MNNIRTWYWVAIFLVQFSPAWTQVTFDSLPKPLQFMPREEDNYGYFRVSGTSGDPAISQITSIIADSSGTTIYEQKTFPLIQPGTFSFTHRIYAALKEYYLFVYAKKNNVDTLITTVPNLVCGDVFFIDGQSNSTAALDPPVGLTEDSLYSNKYCRALGWGADIAFFDSIPIDSDRVYARPTCIYWSKGFIGSWGMKLQHDLAVQTGIPNCFANGGRSGTVIRANLPSHTPSDPNALNVFISYDRLFSKLYFTGLQKYVKGIFWYQGEADAALPRDSAEQYNQKFLTLYNSWKTDYPSLKLVQVLQINTGCGGTFNGLIADKQRQLHNLRNDIKVMATVGTLESERSHDGCHYTLQGYDTLGTKLVPVVKKYVYGYPLDDKNIFPPFVSEIKESDFNQLCITFDKNIVFQNSLSVAGTELFLRDYFYGLNYVSLKITSMSSSENKLYLNFAENSFLPDKLTYLPPNFAGSHIYTGPWILNENSSIGAASFYEVPVTKRNIFGENEVVAYPNPATGHIKLFINAPEPLSSEITIEDSQGKLVFRLHTDKTRVTLSTDQFDPGVYFIRMMNEKGTSVKKIVVIK